MPSVPHNPVNPLPAGVTFIDRGMANSLAEVKYRCGCRFFVNTEKFRIPNECPRNCLGNNLAEAEMGVVGEAPAASAPKPSPPPPSPVNTSYSPPVHERLDTVNDRLHLILRFLSAPSPRPDLTLDILELALRQVHTLYQDLARETRQSHINSYLSKHLDDPASSAGRYS